MREYKKYEDIQANNFLAIMSMVTGLSVFPSKYSDVFQKFQIRYVQMEIIFLVVIYLYIMYSKFIHGYGSFPRMYGIIDFVTSFGLFCTDMVCILLTAFVRKHQFQYFITSATSVHHNCKEKYARTDILKQSKFLYFHVALLTAVITGACSEICYVWNHGHEVAVVAAVKYIHMFIVLEITIEFAYNCTTLQNYTRYLNSKLFETFSYINKARQFTKNDKRMRRFLYSTCDTRFFLINYDKVFDMDYNICKLYGIQIIGIIFLQFVTTVDGVFTVLKTLYDYEKYAGISEWMILKLVWSAGNFTVSVFVSFLICYLTRKENLLF